ncbi:MAG: lamin tail domain-containing protein [Acidimicrobiia bacterium]|nr:lamin tail domain-containing protein [Acidimicrobiia bacterium]
MFRRVVTVASLLLALPSCSQNGTAVTAGVPDLDAAGGVTAVIFRILDGDSFEAMLADGTIVEVRLLGINAPERDECYHEDAASALEKLMPGEIVLVSDAEETDRYGRLLSYALVADENVNLAMVTEGHAVALQSGHTLEPSFVDAANGAAVTGRGLWSATACGFASPLPAVQISEFEFDPPGRDADEPNREWVTFRNRGQERVDLEGWIVRDESTQHRFVFPSGAELAAGSSVTVRSGCGDPTPEDLYWCAGDPVWSNGGDTIIIQLPDGTVVDWERYAGTR